MRYRRLGATGLEVSEVGFGAWGIGGVRDGAASYGPTDDDESLRALRRAFELGVTFYDTSDLYGQGHSERLIGTAFKRVRERVVLATKVGFLASTGPQDFSERHIHAAFEGSLRRLQTDYVDLYQLHNPPIELLASEPEIVEALAGLKREGKVRAIGISVRSPEDGFDAVTRFGFKAMQVNFSMVDQRARANGLLALCEREDVGVICRTPLCYGFLTGKYSSDYGFDAHDHRGRWPVEQLARWAEAPSVFGAAVRCEDHTQAQLALRFCLSYPSVATTIPGMLTPAHAEENARTSALGPLAEAERMAIEDVYRYREFFVGAPKR